MANAAENNPTDERCTRADDRRLRADLRISATLVSTFCSGRHPGAQKSAVPLQPLRPEGDLRLNAPALPAMSPPPGLLTD